MEKPLAEYSDSALRKYLVFLETEEFEFMVQKYRTRKIDHTESTDLYASAKFAEETKLWMDKIIAVRQQIIANVWEAIEGQDQIQKNMAEWGC